MKNFFVIGKVPAYNGSVDPDGKEQNKLYKRLTFIDLYPRTIKLNGPAEQLKNFSFDQMGKMFQNTVKYANPTHPMKWLDMVLEKHKDLLDSYTLGKYDGIRLIATTDSAVNNSITHQYKNNPLDSGLTGAIEGLKAVLQQQGGKLGLIGKGLDMLSGLSDLYDLYSGNQYNPDQAAKGAIKAFTSGQRTKFPKIWDSGNVADILQLSVKLTSPSGHPKFIKRLIIEPLVILFIMSSPLTVSGLDLSTPFIYEVDAHGLGHYKLAGITNINFDRGGSDVLFNKYSQPLTVNCRITVMPLATDAVTALKDTSLYDAAWYQTPKTIFDSLQPHKEGE